VLKNTKFRALQQICLYFHHCFGFGSALDPHSIGFPDPDPGGVKSAKIEGKTDPKDRKFIIKF
jgi:hypothetical protein